MEQAIIDAIKPYLVQFVITRLIAVVPFLSGSFFSFFLNPIIGWVVGIILTDGQKILNFTIVDFATAHEQAAYVEACKQIIAVQGSTDAVAIQKAKNALSAALGPLIQFDVNAPGVIKS